MATDKDVVVKYADVEYPLITELSEREKFEAERIAGRSLDDLGNYTAALILAHFTLKRAGEQMSWDTFLDTSGFEFVEKDVPLAAVTVLAEECGDETTGTGGPPLSPTPSDSTLVT
jgi:hypothetical protein